MSLSSLEILSYKKCVKYANELTDDVVHPTLLYSDMLTSTFTPLLLIMTLKILFFNIIL